MPTPKKSRLFAYTSIFVSLFAISLFYTNCTQGFVSVSVESNIAPPYSYDSSSNLPGNGQEDSPPAPDMPTIEYGSFIPKQVSRPPVSPLPPFIKKAYTTSPVTQSFAIVYSRIPRVKDTMAFTNYNGVFFPALKNWDVLQTLPETSHRLSGMSGPGQLVYRDRSGNERILFDCIPTNDCLPMDPMVSFDGKKVIFSLLKGKSEKGIFRGQTLPYTRMNITTEAQLIIADIQSGQLTYLPHVAGTFDTGPVFLPDGKIMFTSNRSNDFGISHFYFSPILEKTLQLWTANVDGSGAERVGPHEIDGALHPFVMTDGRVLFSTWQIRHLQPYGQNNGSLGAPGTRDNKFWLASVDYSGGEWMSVLGAHGHDYMIDGNLKDFKALHFVTETTSGFLCSTEYYRANNFGAGNIICWQKEGLGIEGKGPQEEKEQHFMFVPRNLFRTATWTTSSDNFSTYAGGKYLGKLRDPMALPGNQLLVTYMKGACAKVQDEISVESLQNEPYGCDGGIYRTSQIPSASPNDLVKIVDSPDWQEYMARVAEPYEFVYGKTQPDLPKLQRDKKNRCILASSSLESEVESVSTYTYYNATDCATQGCKVRSIPMENVKAIRFWEVLPNKDLKVMANRMRSVTGNEQKLLGDVPLNEDGSFAVELPCNTPYLMAGVDQDGNTILRDQVPQSLRTGEIRTCTGCHLHSKPGRPFEQSLAYNQLNSPFQLTNNKVPMMKKGWWISEGKINPQPEYTRDIEPILRNKCMSCHSGITAARGLRFDIPGTSILNPSNPDKTSSWYRISWDASQYFVPNKVSYSPIIYPTNFSLEKPHTSLYINSAFAIESLFLWKAVNARLDNRMDSSYPYDVDFGPSHPTKITDDEFRLIRDWIDSGVYAKFID